MTSPDRTAALARLVALGVTNGDTAEAASPLERTGAEVYAGGDVARTLLRDDVALTYRDGDLLSYAQAGQGDTILVTPAQARRLDELGVTVAVTADLEAAVAELSAGLPTDEQLAGMSAFDLIAHVIQNPDERDRVREVEQARKSPRSTVLSAVTPTPDADADAAYLEAERAAAAREDARDAALRDEL